MAMTMNALVLRSFEDALFERTTLARPEPGPGQVLVRVVASGVNPIDTKIRMGKAPYAMPELPAVLGTELAGVVEALGAGVTSFKVGEEVFGMVGGVRGLQGTLAEFVAADAATLALKPANLSMREAAALPLVTLTAWEGLIERAGVQAGHKVLVQGGAGGVGHVAIQIARARGAQVYATASKKKHELVASLGATPIDYAEQSVEAYVKQHTGGAGFDVVYDTVGGTTLDASLKAIKPYGHIASCSAFGTHSLAPGSLRCATLSGIFVLFPLLNGGAGRSRQGSILKEAAALVSSGALKPIVDPRRFTMNDGQSAHSAVQDGSALIKIVIDVVG